MNSLRSLEGYILIDHRNSPGVPDSVMTRQGLVAGAGRGVFESPTFTCSHCEVIVIMNPNRSRSRGFCPKCNHYVCDACEQRRVASGYECKPFKAMVEEYLNSVSRRPDKSADEAVSEVFQSPLITL